MDNALLSMTKPMMQLEWNLLWTKHE